MIMLFTKVPLIWCVHVICTQSLNHKQVNVRRIANSEPFYFNFEIGNVPYSRHVNQVQGNYMDVTKRCG